MAEGPKRTARLEISRVEDGFMIYQPDKDRVHYLNHTAVLVLELCNGRHSPARIAELLKNAYGLADAPEKEVNEILAKMAEEGLVAQKGPGQRRSHSATKAARRRHPGRRGG